MSAASIRALEEQVLDLRLKLRESGDYRDGLAEKVIELEGLNARLADRLAAEQQRFTARCSELKAVVRAFIPMLAVPNDHMSACDRIMGATHPCTCGADAARKLLDGLEYQLETKR